MTSKQKYDLFIEFIEFKSIYDLSKIFKVSEPTISRYKSGNVVIPDYILEIIYLHKKILNLESKINHLDFNLKSNEQFIYDFKKSFLKLIDISI